MTGQFEALSVFVAIEFVVVASVVLLVVPLEAALPILPLFLVLLFALHRYRS